MFDADAEVVLPKYQVRYNGELKEFDPIELAFSFRSLEGVEDPAKIRDLVNEVMGIDIDALRACAILKDFMEFATSEEVDQPLKKVFGRGLFLDTTLESVPENIKSSVPENTLGT